MILVTILITQPPTIHLSSIPSSHIKYHRESEEASSRTDIRDSKAFCAFVEVPDACKTKNYAHTIFKLGRFSRFSPPCPHDDAYQIQRVWVWG
jgi:hypothetical protein